MVWVAIGFQFGIMILVYTKDASFSVLFSRVGLVSVEYWNKLQFIGQEWVQGT